jgi:hypothetical protein
LIRAAPRPNCHHHAGIGKQAALFAQKRAKNFIRLATPGGRRGRSFQPPRAQRRHEVFLLLFVHKKKTLLASLRRASTRSATGTFL